MLDAHLCNQHVICGSHAHVAGRLNLAFIVDRLSDQDDVASKRIDAPEVYDASSPDTGEVEVSRGEIGVRDVARAGYEAIRGDGPSRSN